MQSPVNCDSPDNHKCELFLLSKMFFSSSLVVRHLLLRHLVRQVPLVRSLR